jgi:hypothetical protein
LLLAAADYGKATITGQPIPTQFHVMVRKSLKFYFPEKNYSFQAEQFYVEIMLPDKLSLLQYTKYVENC